MLASDVAEALSARLVGDGSLRIDRVVHPADAEGQFDLAVALTSDTFGALASSKALAALVMAPAPPAPERVKTLIVADHERLALAKLTALFDGGPARNAGIDPTAVVAADAVIGEGVVVGPFVAIGPRVRIGARTVILSHTTIGADVTIGEQGLIYAGVRIGDRVTIGDRAIIHYNAVIGSDGFSFLPVPQATGGSAPKKALPTRIHSLGKIVIGDDVEIGACSTIARATLETTRIADGTKVDNHVHIAHNVTIGEACLIAGMVGVSGSVTIGDRVMLGGGVGIADHVNIGSDSMVAAASAVGTNVGAGAKVAGYPAMPHERALETYMYLRRLRALYNRVKVLDEKIEALQKSARNDKG
jgi:UDP-3-O-[3-hydroxymyristoyl] glucosamine N-acyltransferase